MSAPLRERGALQHRLGKLRHAARRPLARRFSRLYADGPRQRRLGQIVFGDANRVANGKHYRRESLTQAGVGVLDRLGLAVKSGLGFQRDQQSPPLPPQRPSACARAAVRSPPLSHAREADAPTPGSGNPPACSSSRLRQSRRQDRPHMCRASSPTETPDHELCYSHVYPHRLCGQDRC